MTPNLAVAAALLAALALASAAPRTQPAFAAPAATKCENAQIPQELEADTNAPEATAAGAMGVITVEAPRAKLRLAVAADERARELGLMCETRLRPRHGMIFVFERDREQEFWMKKTLIPLDMVWVRSDGTVDTVAANVPAATLETPDGKLARRIGRGLYVIELRGGEAADDGIARGAKLAIPALRGG